MVGEKHSSALYKLRLIDPRTRADLTRDLVSYPRKLNYTNYPLLNKRGFIKTLLSKHISFPGLLRLKLSFWTLSTTFPSILDHCSLKITLNLHSFHLKFLPNSFCASWIIFPGPMSLHLSSLFSKFSMNQYYGLSVFSLFRKNTHHHFFLAVTLNQSQNSETRFIHGLFRYI